MLGVEHKIALLGVCHVDSDASPRIMHTVVVVDGDDDDDDDDEMMMMIRKDYQRKWYPHPFSSVFLQITRLY